MTTPNADKNPHEVSAMFDRVAAGYDRANLILSLGLCTIWRRQTAKAVDAKRGERILDVAAGTGTSSKSFTKKGAQVTGADFSPGMISFGARKHAQTPNLRFVEADAMNLPFKDGEFDATTISFGLRNIADPQKALEEFFRVTRSGGRLVVCEFSTPPNRLVAFGYSIFRKIIMRPLAKITSSDPDAYRYLDVSIATWPTQPRVAEWIRSAGFVDVEWRDLNLGTVALHRATKP